MDLVWAVINSVIDLLSTPCLVQRRRRQGAHKVVARRMERLVTQEIARVEQEQEKVRGFREAHRAEAEANVAGGASQVVVQSDQQRAAKYEEMLAALDAKLETLHATRLSITTNLEVSGTVAETMDRYAAVVGRLSQLQTESQLSGLALNLKGLLEQSDYAGAVTREILSKGLTDQVEDPPPARPVAAAERQSLLGEDDNEIELDEDFLLDDPLVIPPPAIPLSSPAPPPVRVSPAPPAAPEAPAAPARPRHPGLSLKTSDIYKYEQQFLRGGLVKPPALEPGQHFRKLGQMLE